MTPVLGRALPVLVPIVVSIGLFVAWVGLSAAPAAAAGCKLMKVADSEDARLIVYFTRFEREDQTGGRYRDCRIVSRCRQDCIRFFITRFRQDATVIVHRSNWP